MGGSYCQLNYEDLVSNQHALITITKRCTKEIAGDCKQECLNLLVCRSCGQPIGIHNRLTCGAMPKFNDMLIKDLTGMSKL